MSPIPTCNYLCNVMQKRASWILDLISRRVLRHSPYCHQIRSTSHLIDVAMNYIFEQIHSHVEKSIFVSFNLMFHCRSFVLHRFITLLHPWSLLKIQSDKLKSRFFHEKHNWGRLRVHVCCQFETEIYFYPESNVQDTRRGLQIRQFKKTSNLQAIIKCPKK